MTLGENLQYIRGKFGLTQDQLAEQLDVSRQSVSKWESGASFPETEKILQICDMYNVSVDDLMRGDVRQEFAADNASYDKHMNSFSRAIAAGVGLVLTGVTALLFTESYRVSETVSTLILMLFILVAVPVFIIYGVRHGEFCKKNPYIENFYSQKEIDAFNRKFPVFIAVPVALILAGVILIIAAEELTVPSGWGEDFFVAIFMACVTIAVPFIVYGGIQKSKYEIEEYNRDNYDPNNNPSEEAREKYAKGYNPLIGRICGCIMLLATAIFLLLGLVWARWDICWVAFPIGGVLCGAVSVALGREGIAEKAFAAYYQTGNLAKNGLLQNVARILQQSILY